MVSTLGVMPDRAWAAPAGPATPSASASVEQPATEPVIITDLRWDGEQLIVSTDRLLRFRSFPLREPDRVVVDLFDAELGDPTLARIMTIDREPVRQVRIGAHPEEGFLRVVIDCDRPVPIQISQPRGLPRLVIQPRGLAPAPERDPEAPEAPREAPKVVPADGRVELAAEPKAIRQETKKADESQTVEAAEAPKAEAPKAEPIAPDASKAAAPEPAPLKAIAPEPETPEALKIATPKAEPSQEEPPTAVAKRSEEDHTPKLARRSGLLREESGLRVMQTGANTVLTLHGVRARDLRIEQAVDPARLLVQLPAGTIKGALPKGVGKVESLKLREQGDRSLLEVGLPEDPLDIRNHMENDGRTLVLTIRRQPLSSTGRPLVLIDPGHGGDDPGALGTGGTRESDVNLAIALKLQDALRPYGIDGVLTRTGDLNVELAARAYHIDQLGVLALISLHANSHDMPSALGLETYYRTRASEGLARRVHHMLVTELKRPDRGVRQARLYVLRHPTVPSVLIEAGFVSNPEEEALLADGDYQWRAAEAIAKGVAGYLSMPLAELSP